MRLIPDRALLTPLLVVLFGTSSVAAGCPADAPASPRAEATPVAAGAPTVRAVIAKGLEVPWAIDFLSDETALLTERESGLIKSLTREGRGWRTRTVAKVPGVAAAGEGGLLGLAISPHLGRDTRDLYVYVTTKKDNRVLRGTWDGRTISQWQPILTGIPKGEHHNGGRLIFGPDNNLYAGTGEVGIPALSQRPGSLGGKILRFTTEGKPAPGNPNPKSVVWSLGHRNVEGLAFIGKTLWASEFGQDSFDELNRIVPGRNYGWPITEGFAGKTEVPAGYQNPVRVWTPAEASPAGLAATGDTKPTLWMSALRGQRLWRIRVDGVRAPQANAFFTQRYGRLRTATATPWGTLWVSTSNHDAWGEPGPGDDRVLEITVK